MPPLAPEVLSVGDLTGAIARAEAVLQSVRREPTPPPAAVSVQMDASGPSGTQRIAALTAADADRVLRTDSILVLDEYAFNYPAGRLDTFLLPEERPAPRRMVARRALISWLALAILLPFVLTAIFVAGVGIGQNPVDVGAATGNILRAPATVMEPVSQAPAASGVGALPDFEARTNRFSRIAPVASPRSRR